MKNVLVLTMPNTRQYTIDTSGNNMVGTVFLLISVLTGQSPL